MAVRHIDERVDAALPESAPAPQEHHSDLPIAPEGEPKTTVLLWALGIIVVLVGLVFLVKYIIPEKGPPTIEYNHFTFVESAGLWMTNWQRGADVYEVSLRYNPLQTENISIRGELNATAGLQPAYITFDPTAPELQFVALAAAELGLNYARGLGRQIEAACTVNETDACASRPIVSCDDADKAVILLNQTGPASIELRGNCIELTGTRLELTRSVDRLLYHFFRIQP